MLQDEHCFETLENEILWNHRKSVYSLFVTFVTYKKIKISPRMNDLRIYIGSMEANWKILSQNAE